MRRGIPLFFAVVCLFLPLIVGCGSTSLTREEASRAIRAADFEEQTLAVTLNLGKVYFADRRVARFYEMMGLCGYFTGEWLNGNVAAFDLSEKGQQSVKTARWKVGQGSQRNLVVPVARLEIKEITGLAPVDENSYDVEGLAELRPTPIAEELGRGCETTGIDWAAMDTPVPFKPGTVYAFSSRVRRYDDGWRAIEFTRGKPVN